MKVKSMNNIELLMSEHDNILRMIEKMEEKCVELMKDKSVDVEIFHQFVDFARNYGDKHHHGKEELILFKYMVDNLGPAAEKLVNHGMLVEHELGRFYVRSLEDKVEAYKDSNTDENRLGILTAAMGYGDLLRRHIEKENEVAYTFGVRALSKELMAKVEEETLSFEKEHRATKEKYENWLNSL